MLIILVLWRWRQKGNSFRNSERVLGIYQKSGNVEDSLHYLSAHADGTGHWAGRSRQHCHKITQLITADWWAGHHRDSEWQDPGKLLSTSVLL